jgi:hypothetical protein
MLHRISNVNLTAIDARFFERTIHDFSRWSDKWFAGDIFVVSRLFAQQHDWRARGSFPKNGLRGAFVKRTGDTLARSFANFS